MEKLLLHYSVNYTTNFKIEYKRFILKYEHMCAHPIISNIELLMDQSYYRASYDKITLKIKIL